MTWKETKNFNITKTTFEERMEEAGYRPDKEVIMTEEEIDVEIKAVEKRLKYLKQKALMNLKHLKQNKTLLKLMIMCLVIMQQVTLNTMLTY